MRQLCGYTMYLVKEYCIKTKVCMEKTKLKPIDTYITLRQLRFLSRIAKMPENRLTRQVVNSQASQAAPQGNCSRGQRNTKRAYRDALKHTGLCDEKGDIKTSEWIECLKAEGTPQVIERNLDLEPGSFTKEKWKER